MVLRVMLTIRKPTFSFIIPAYNIENYIAECLESLISQSYDEWEAIVVDDGSTDQTGTIIDGYSQRDERIHVSHQKNLGVSAARNKGIELAEGEWICFVDGDDFIHPDYLTIVRSSINKYKGIDMFLFNHIQSKTISFAPISDFKEQCIDISTSIEDHIWRKGLWDAVYRRNIIIGIDFFRSPLGEDLLFFHQCLLKCNKVIYINMALYAYRERDDSAVHTMISYKKTIGSMQCSIKTLEQLFMGNKTISNSSFDLLLRTVFETPALRCLSLPSGEERKNVFQEWLRLTKGLLVHKMIWSYMVRVKLIHSIKWYGFWILLMGLPLQMRIILCKFRDSLKKVFEICHTLF